MAFRLAAVALAALVVAPSAAAKLVPQFDRAVAVEGARVTVDLQYVQPYVALAPVEVFLVRTCDEPFVQARPDGRLVRVGRLPRDDWGVRPSRVSFVVAVPPGRYTLAVWWRGRNVTAGLWRDARAGRRLLLDVVAS